MDLLTQGIADVFPLDAFNNRPVAYQLVLHITQKCSQNSIMPWQVTTARTERAESRPSRVARHHEVRHPWHLLSRRPEHLR